MLKRLRERLAKRVADDRPMPITEHLEALRWHVLRSILYVIAGGCFSWWQYTVVYNLMTGPIERAYVSAHLEFHMTFFHVLDPLLFKLQLVGAAGVILALPPMILEVWGFVRPALKPDELRFVRPLVPFSLALCLAGLTVVYFALPIALEFLLRFLPQTNEIELRQNPQLYFAFLLRMMIGMAVVFQTPIVLLLLGELEIVTASGLVHFWRHAILLCFLIAAVVTPTVDPFNMSVIALPLCTLYCLSVSLVWRVERKRARRQRLGGDDEPPPDDAPPPPPSPADLPPPAKQGLLPSPEPAVSDAPPVIDRSVLGPLAVPPPAPPDESGE